MRGLRLAYQFRGRMVHESGEKTAIIFLIETQPQTRGCLSRRRTKTQAIVIENTKIIIIQMARPKSSRSPGYGVRIRSGTALRSGHRRVVQPLSVECPIEVSDFPGSDEFEMSYKGQVTYGLITKIEPKQLYILVNVETDYHGALRHRPSGWLHELSLGGRRFN
jgi:hypothetical protein